MSRRLRQLRLRLAALLVAVLVLVPVTEAFACSFEDLPHAADAALDPSADAAHADGDVAHEACSHQHCHHTLSTPPPPGLVAGLALRRDAVSAHADTHSPSRRSDGPMRPPRA